MIVLQRVYDIKIFDKINPKYFQPFDDSDRDKRTRSPSHLTPILERKKKDTVLNFEDEILKRK